ncbi:MAG: segregation/condensation protein A [Candidatus Nanoarchaeia archaeon]|nr:segregation/condensation protein A [Candidatus Haiyanarchaeum thermophilum]MCW1303386.1 segregation/condensation protein A [Candidatus Haiyanarchaeum thermophilum]MCW1303926.1 segregation/condensation protein A [Candidatus Haiyanarchaeum thermophilum]MCW1306748.1 segregation/condensation protein A [Candidatus Haiyanarchaeum thermophilum]MCW1307413.1 segregation/condensation protein A [Candidatus Haiyanarchaeum thermophilum]
MKGYEDRLIELILSNKLTWEGLIKEIIKEEGIDPWDIDIGLLLRKYIEIVGKAGEINLRSIGSFILILAILLKIKSELMFPEEIEDNELLKLALGIDLNLIFSSLEDFKLYPRAQTVKYRKVTLDELISALKRAFEVSRRREARKELPKLNLELSKLSLMKRVQEVYERVSKFFEQIDRDVITLSELVPSGNKFDLIWTLIPLLHLETEGKIYLRQEIPFGEVYVERRKS